MYIDEDRKTDYEDLKIFDIYQKPLTIVSNYIRGGWYIVNDNDIITPFTETGYLPNKKWINYFNSKKIEEGYLLVHLKYFSDIDDFSKRNEFGSFLLDKYDFKIVKKGNRFIEYYFKNK